MRVLQMTKKRSSKKKNTEEKPQEPETKVVASTESKLSRVSLLPKDLFREIQELKRRVSELEKKSS